MRIDAHQHFWALERGDYNWLTPDYEILYRDYLPVHLSQELVNHHIDKTIIVQAADSVEETYYMFDLMRDHSFIAGVVGWLDFESVDFKKDLESMMKLDGFVGVRPMLQDIDDDRWVLQDIVVKNIKHLHKQNIPLDILIYPKHLKVIEELLEKIPDLKCVINHLAKPEIKSQEYDEWSRDIEAVSQYPNVYCKISGVITEADHKSWTIDDCRKYIEHSVNIFSENRIMFGSDWPVCLQAGSYSDVYEVAYQTISELLSENGMKKFYGENALVFYNRMRSEI